MLAGTDVQGMRLSKFDHSCPEPTMASFASITPALSQTQLSVYLEKINVSTQQRQPNFQTLCQIQKGQARHINWDNMAMHHPKCKERGETITTDIDRIFNKLVKRPRGGYCFEANALLAAALAALGFELFTVAGRVNQNMDKEWPHELALTCLGHQVTIVRLGEQDWLVDAGFGGKGLIDPLPVCQMAGFRTKHGLVTDCSEHSVPGYGHRMRAGLLMDPDIPTQEQLEAQAPLAGAYVQALNSRGGWSDLYFLQPVATRAEDFAALNYAMAHDPDSPMAAVPMAARQTETGRCTLIGNSFKMFEGNRLMKVVELQGNDEAAAVLKEHFHCDLDVPPA